MLSSSDTCNGCEIICVAEPVIEVPKAKYGKSEQTSVENYNCHNISHSDVSQTNQTESVNQQMIDRRIRDNIAFTSYTHTAKVPLGF